MTMQEAIQLGQAAKAKGYIVAIAEGKAQFQTALPLPDGSFDIMAHTDWLEYDEAMEIIEGWATP